MPLATRIPPLAQTDLEALRRRAWDKTNSTAGPGVRHRTVSVSTKSSQVSHFMSIHYRRRARFQNVLCVDSSLLDGMSNPANGQHISSNTVVDIMSFGKMHHVGK